MRKRRFAQVATSDDDDEKPLKKVEEEKGRKKKRQEEEEEEEEEDTEEEEEDEAGDEESEGEDEAGEEADAKSIGDVVKVSGRGRNRKNHYASFEYDGNRFELEDPVLLTPEERTQKPYVAIIKDITQDSSGSLMVTGQWFYRPEEAEKKGGGSWQARDTRELFYSFHLDEVPAESVMHKCVVHFVPLNKQLPIRSQHPGFIIQRVYDTVERKLWKLTDKDYQDDKQHEIDLLVQKTRKNIGELPDIETEEPSLAEQEDPLKNKRSVRKKNTLAVDVSRNDDLSTKSETLSKAETPGSCTSDVSEYYIVLANCEVLTGDAYRDKWLEKLLQGIQFVCTKKSSTLVEDKVAPSGAPLKSSATVNGSQDKSPNTALDSKVFIWPDDVVPAITSLEKAAHEALGSDFQKYNQKMRQLDFNLKNNRLLARRLLNRELEPSIILGMSPTELKDGLTAEEKTKQEPEKAKHMQMTDARCKRCSEKKVGVADVIQAGLSGDRYQLECVACGHTWYASRDAISSLTIDTPTVVGNVGTAPWATSKFESVEKKLVSPRESERPPSDIFQKSTAAHVPVLDTQKSLNRGKPEDAPPNAAD